MCIFSPVTDRIFCLGIWGMDEERENGGGKVGMLVKNYDEVKQTEERKIILDCLNHVFSSLSPSSAVERYAEKISGDIDQSHRVFVIGFGKASLAMYSGIRKKVMDKLAYAGIIVPEDQDISMEFGELEILRGNHPKTSALSVRSSKTIIGHLNGLKNDDLVVVLISGGGSALFEIPENGVDIETLSSISDCMMKHGADIYELNRIRQLMSSVKGGKLADILKPAKVRSMIVSDVTGDELSIIASGPLVNPSDPGTVGNIISRYGDRCEGMSILEKFYSARHDGNENLKNVENLLVLRNYDYVNSAGKFLIHNGKDVIRWRMGVTGEVSDVAANLANIVRSMFRLFNKPFWLVFGGETTVNVTGKGKGGRNQELVLRFMNNMERNELFTFASTGTDGIDGYSDAMGGISDSLLKNKIPEHELLESLENSDSNTILSKYGSAVVTGRTGTNVSDMMILYYGGKTGRGRIDDT